VGLKGIAANQETIGGHFYNLSIGKHEITPATTIAAIVGLQPLDWSWQMPDDTEHTLDIDAALNSIRIQNTEGGPRVPDNPLGRLIPETPDEVQVPTRKVALTRMHTARIAQLKSIFLRKHLNDKAE
jgi:hypothetical protein